MCIRDSLKAEIAELRAANTPAMVRLNPLSDATGAELDAAVSEGLIAVTLPKAASAAMTKPLWYRRQGRKPSPCLLYTSRCV